MKIYFAGLALLLGVHGVIAHPLVDRMEHAASAQKWDAVAAMAGRLVRMPDVDAAVLDQAGQAMRNALREDNKGIWTETVKVASGNTLGGLAKKHGSTVEMIQWLNGLKGASIRRAFFCVGFWSGLAIMPVENHRPNALG